MQKGRRMSRPSFCRRSPSQKWRLSFSSFTSGGCGGIVLTYGIIVHAYRQGLEEARFSKEDWCNLLSISHRYECERARERSIKEINKIGPPVDNADRILMSKKFGVEEWLIPACVALVERGDPLTHSEAQKLGLDMVVLISEAREKYILGDLRIAGDTTQLVKDVLQIK